MPATADNSRNKDAARWMNVVVRTAHVGAAAMLFGLAMPPRSIEELAPWRYLAIATGDVLIVLELLQDRRWPHRGKGLLIMLHVGLFLLLPLQPRWDVALLWAILIVGSVCSHMPRSFRHWSILDGWEQRGKPGNADGE